MDDAVRVEKEHAEVMVAYFDYNWAEVSDLDVNCPKGLGDGVGKDEILGNIFSQWQYILVEL